MHAAIKAFNPGSETLIPEGCHIIELSNSEADADVSIARARVEPGITTQWHRLAGITERYVIISGEGTVEVGELQPTAVKSGDVVIIPPLYRQRITNNGKEDLIFLAICTPRFVPGAYQNILEK